jgi:hypothetical protein
MTSHDSFFGFIHGFKINRNNLIFGSSTEEYNPYPTIISQPTFQQCVKNWNIADTGVFLTTVVLGTLVSWKVCRLSSHSIHEYFTLKR